MTWFIVHIIIFDLSYFEKGDSARMARKVDRGGLTRAKWNTQHSEGDDMDLTGSVRIPAARETVWRALNDPEILRRCIPGCERMTREDGDVFTATVAAKVGPVSAKFSGKVSLCDVEPPNGYRLVGEGSGGVAGFGKGEAAVTLAEEGDETVLSYIAKAKVGGKLAQIGQRLVDATARKLADDFFARFAAEMAGPAPADG